MLRCQRPQKPATFDRRVADIRQSIEARARCGEDLTFEDLWGEFKSIFAEAQHNKCGFCECFVICVDHGDVEHFRPKGEIGELSTNPGLWGRQEAHSASVQGRQIVMVCATGYWWLAYEWDNYLLSCKICNRGYKRTLFPVLEHPRPAPPLPAAVETPLLLNPFDGPPPSEHLEFSRDGLIAPYKDSQYGLETIRTCGLDRPNLTLARREKAIRAHGLIAELRRTETDEHIERVLSDLCNLGDARTVHAGMVRAIFEQGTETPWDEMCAVLQSLPSPG